MFLALILSISFYHALTTEQFIAPSGKKQNFSFSGYVQSLGEYGVKRTRVFADLPWYWRYDLGPIVKPHFNARFTILPFVYLPKNKTWDFQKPNQEFQKRLTTAGETATNLGMDILLCFVTQGPDLKCPYFRKMGYDSALNYYEEPDNSHYRSSGVWTKFLNHFRTVAGATSGYRQQYRYYEPYNEQKSISIVDELRFIAQAVHDVRGKYAMQLNLPNPLYAVGDFVSTSAYLSALRQLTHSSVIRVKRLSFHGIYSAEGVHRLASILRAAEISPSICEISTDGATPWQGRFSEQSHIGDMSARRYWNKTAQSIQAVIQAHVEIVKAARAEGFAVCDIQDVIKWTGDLDSNKPEVRKFYRSLIQAAR